MGGYKIAELHESSLSSDPAAPLIVLLHGFGASTFTWRGLIPALREIGEVWAYDRPGFGFTDAPSSWVGTNPYSIEGQVEFLSERVEQLAEGRRVIVLGHSSGGQLATYFAFARPDLVSALVLVSPALRSAGLPRQFEWLMRNPLMDWLGPKATKGFDKVGMKILFDSVHDKRVLTTDMVAGYRAPMDDPRWVNRFWEFLRAPQPRDQKVAAAAVACPTLIVTGDDDKIIPVGETRANAELYVDHRLVLIEQTGHLSFEEKPDEFMAHIRANLQWLLP